MNNNATTEDAVAATELRDSMLLVAVVMLVPMVIIGIINLFAFVQRTLI